MGRVLLVVAILLALVMAIFGVQNPQPVIIQFLNVQTSFVPLYVVILVSALAGIVLSMIAGLRGRIAQRLRIRKLERRVTELEKELAVKSSARIVDVPDSAASASTPAIH